MGPYGPGPGPRKAGKVQDKHVFVKHIFIKNRRFCHPYNVFLWFHNDLQIVDRNTLPNDYKITSKSKFSNQNVQFWYLLHPALSHSLQQVKLCIYGFHSHVLLHWGPLPRTIGICFPDLLTSSGKACFLRNVFFRFLAEIRFRTMIKLPQKASSRTQMCSFGTSCTLP